MPYSAIYGISAEVEKVENAEIEARGNVLLKVTYTGIGLYESLEETLVIATNETLNRFEGAVTITTVVDGKGELTEARFGSTAYAPYGQTEIPLMFISQVELDISQDVTKYFEVSKPSSNLE